MSDDHVNTGSRWKSVDTGDIFEVIAGDDADSAVYFISADNERPYLSKNVATGEELNLERRDLLSRQYERVSD